MTELSGEVQSRLNKLGLKGKTITLKLKVRAPNAPKETAKFLGKKGYRLNSSSFNSGMCTHILFYMGHLGVSLLCSPCYGRSFSFSLLSIYLSRSDISDGQTPIV